MFALNIEGDRIARSLFYLDEGHAEGLVHETRLKEHQQVEVPGSAKVRDDDGVHGHRGEKLPPRGRRQRGHRHLRLPERVLDVP